MMTLYDSCISDMEQLFSFYPFHKPEESDTRDIREAGEAGKAGKARATWDGSAWPDAGKNQLIFRSDSAYELGGGTLPAVSGIALTADQMLVPRDEILLCGNDLPQLTKDTPYARVAFIRIRDDAMGEGSTLYQSIRKIEYTRYHLNPKGYMMRISTMNQRESVRISRQALQEGLSFSRVGRLFVEAYHKHPAVEAVRLFFITLPDFPYGELSKSLERSENITKALDHLLQKVKMDCNACNLKEICAEVEQLCKKDFPDRQEK